MQNLLTVLSRALLPSVLLAATSAMAHETWLLPERFVFEEPGTVNFTLTSGMGFPAPDSAISPSRVSASVLHQGSGEAPLTPQGQGEGVLKFTAKGDAGEACAWVALKPRTLTLDLDSVDHYLDEIGADAKARAAWESETEPRRWRESYGKLARSYLQLGNEIASVGCEDEFASRGFDIRPVQNPIALLAGSILQLRLTLGGELLAGQAVGLEHAGTGRVPLKRSDETGLVSFHLEQPGTYMVYAVHLEHQPGEDTNWTSEFVTLTFEIADSPQ